MAVPLLPGASFGSHFGSLPHAHIRTRFKWLNIITLTLTLPGASFDSHFGLIAPAHIATHFKWLNMITLTLTRTLQHVLNGFVVGVIVLTLPLHQNLWMFVSERHTDVFNLSTWFIGCIHSFTFIDSHLLNTQYSASLTTPDIFAHHTALIFPHHTTHFFLHHTTHSFHTTHHHTFLPLHTTPQIPSTPHFPSTPHHTFLPHHTFHPHHTTRLPHHIIHLPESIKEKDSIQSFRPLLKTHFFTQG